MTKYQRLGILWEKKNPLIFTVFIEDWTALVRLIWYMLYREEAYMQEAIGLVSFKEP